MKYLILLLLLMGCEGVKFRAERERLHACLLYAQDRYHHEVNKRTAKKLCLIDYTTSVKGLNDVKDALVDNPSP